MKKTGGCLPAPATTSTEKGQLKFDQRNQAAKNQVITNLVKTGIAACAPRGNAAGYDDPGAKTGNGSGHRGTTQDEPHSNLTFYPIGKETTGSHLR